MDVLGPSLRPNGTMDFLVDGCPRPFFTTFGTIGQCLFLSVNRAVQGCTGQLQKVYAHLVVTLRNHWRWQQQGWSQVPTIRLFYRAKTISWSAPAVSTVDEESRWAGQSALVDSPQQSVGEMSGKTFLLLLTEILCTRA